MKARLIIKNFGPITDLDIEIKKYNILIGPQASGKSTIAKLLCVIHSYYEATIKYKNTLNSLNEGIGVSIPIRNQDNGLFKKLLKNYRIENFLTNKTTLSFEDDFFSFSYSKLSATPVINIDKHIKSVAIAKAYYFPAERIALPIISDSIFELISEQSTLPQYFLQFGREFTLAKKNKDLFNIPILKVDFEYKDERNFVKINDKDTLYFEETSSAIQSNLPLLLILQNLNQTIDTSLFVIEELELHSFPKLQKQLLYHVIEKTREQTLNNAYVVLPTHSPYILSAANNLLFANKMGNQSEESRLETGKIINEASWIDKDDFAAYYIDNGTAKSIVNEQTGLIDENELDSISEDLGEEFDLLMDLYKPTHA